MSAATPPGWPQDRWADAGGRRLRFWEVGEGDPAVVVEGGLGTTVADWAALVPELARRTRTVCYDRAGLGASDPAPGARTAGAMVDDLLVVLERAGLRGRPCVVVAHSWGGLVVRLLAARHPDQVAGLVLLDPTTEESVTPGTLRANRVTYAVMVALARARLLRPLLGRLGTLRGYAPAERDYVLSDLPRAAAAARREAAGVAASVRELADAGSTTLAVPLVVVSAGGTRPRRGPVATAYARVHAGHAGLAGRASRGRHVVADRSGHYVHLDRPDVVLAAVDEVLALVRADQSAPSTSSGAMKRD